MPISEVFNVDCNEYMKTIPDKFFDLAIVDPPYGIGNFTPETDSGSWKKGTKKLKTHYDQNYKWNNYIPGPEYFYELKRISKRRLIWGANYYNCFSPGGALIWYKNQGLTSQLSQCEIASLSWKKQVDFVHIEKLNGFLAPIVYIHPCEKPVSLYFFIINNYAKPGNKIFDSHLGSQSSRIAAYKLGFDFWGCELDPDYFREGCERFDRECLGEIKTKQGTIIKQLNIFE